MKLPSAEELKVLLDHTVVTAGIMVRELQAENARLREQLKQARAERDPFKVSRRKLKEEP